jgi:hybrid cluster-associated redox disulfide protein
MSLPITKDTNLGAIANNYPELSEVLQNDYGLHCVGCFASGFDTLEIGAKVHGYDDKDVTKMVKRLNSLLK